MNINELKLLVTTKRLEVENLKHYNIFVLGFLFGFISRALQGSIEYKIGKKTLEHNAELIHNALCSKEKVA